MTHAAPHPDFVLAVLALYQPPAAAAAPTGIPLPSRWLRRAWRGAYVRVTGGREALRSSVR